MTTIDNIITNARDLNKGDITYLGWQRDIKVNLITEALKKSLPDRIFEVHETINGYSIKSI